MDFTKHYSSHPSFLFIDIEFDGNFVAREAFCSFSLTHRHWTSSPPLKVAFERSGLVSRFLDVFVRLEADC